MQTPVRLVALLKPSVTIGVLLAVGYSTVVFMSTPFLLPEIASHYGISLGAASLIGVTQLGGFVVGTWGAGRRLQPRTRVFTAALMSAAVANVASATLPMFAVLVALRLVHGLTIGVLTWFGWVQAFGDDQRMGDVAVIGPMVGIVAAPLISILTDAGGASALFLVLGAIAIVPLLLVPDEDAAIELPDRLTGHPAVPAARTLLVCLTLFSLGGSSVFQYAVVLGTSSPGLSATTVAIGFSLNAVASIPSARWRRSRGVPSIWMAATAVAALALATTSTGWLFISIITLWGFAFWMAVPAVFSLLVSRSRYPEERAGDAQAMLAIGRVGGPLLGGVLIDGPGTTTLGVVACAIIFVAAAGVFTVRTVASPVHR